MERIDPINTQDQEPDDETRFKCACGDESCWGFNTDPENIRLGSAWYSADCVMANNHPIVVADRVRAAHSDEARDDDAFNRIRR